MNPRLLLSLWRERWGKAADAARGQPYLRGKLNRWGEALTHARAWSLPGVTGLVLLGCAMVYIMLITARFSMGGQLAFSVLFVATALFARRFAGTLVTLVLFCMTAIFSARYLYWRLTETLGSEFNVDFVLGFGLWLAELYLWLFIVLRISQTVWPLKRASLPLPVDATTWPTVDVFILAKGQADSSIKQTTLAALALDWPKTKIKIYILDEAPRDSLREIIDSIGAVYLVPSNPSEDEGQSESINRAWPETKGELILMLDGAQMPDRSLLQSVVGWFVRDKTLGMLQTPHHFLAPAPSSHSLDLCHAPTWPGDVAFAVLRRAMLTDVGGVAPSPVTAQAHTALDLQSRGYGHGYIGCAVTGAAPGIDSAHEQSGGGGEAPRTPVLFRVDGPFFGQRLRWKQRLAALQSMLQFYYTVPRLIFLTAPLAFLLVGAQLIQTTPELLAAHALPYLLLTYFTQARLRGATRLPTWADFRETALAWYLLLPTTLTLLRTELRRCLGAFQVDPHAPFDWLIVWPYGVVALLNLFGLGIGIARLPFLQDPAFEIATLYLLWCACNLMMLASLLAVAEETRHIRQQTRLLLQMPAMVQLTSGRTMTCVTQNFPQTDLSLKLPVPLAVEAGSSVYLTIFRGHREFTYPARVVSQYNSVLSLRIEDAVQNDYRLFGTAVLSRGPDWPRWLPGREADHPVPRWATRLFITGWTKLLAMTRNFDTFVKWLPLGNWMGKWKKKT